MSATGNSVIDRENIKAEARQLFEELLDESPQTVLDYLEELHVRI